MIKEAKIYTVICDNCKKDLFEGSEYAGYTSEKYTLDVAKEAGWIEHNENNYCPDCYDWDDFDDIFIRTEQ